MSRIEEMRQEMIKGGFYRRADIDAICSLEAEYEKECLEIEEQCEAEGYPGNGNNYELRCAEARKYYDEQIVAIDATYPGTDS